MPNIKSAKKRVVVTAKKNAHNKAIKTELKTVLKKANTAIANGDAKSASLNVAVKKVDKAAAKGLLHKNKAARLKSQLAKKANAVG